MGKRHWAASVGLLCSGWHSHTAPSAGPTCRLGTAAAAAAGSCGLPAAAPATAAGEPKERGTLATAPGADTSAADREAERCLSDIRAFVNARVAACAAAAGVDSAISSQSGGSAEQAHGAGLQPLPASASDAELGVVWDALEMSLKTVRP